MEPSRPYRVKTYALIFATGSDMQYYYCKFNAESEDEAKRLAHLWYPDRWTHVAVLDDQFQKYLTNYQRREVPLGSRMILHEPTKDESVD